MPQHNEPTTNITVTGAQMQRAQDEAALRKIARAVLAIAKRQVQEETAEEAAPTEAKEQPHEQP